MKNSYDTVIVGAGPAGLSIANHLERDFIVLEQAESPGGLMRSKTINGYIFDYAGHIFFTRIPRILEAVEKLLGDNLAWHERESWVFSKQTFTRYPFQANTYGLPPNVIKECLLGLIEATYSPSENPPENFRDWIIRTYGEGIARHFMIPYNEKIWARDLSTMDFHWLHGRVPQPGLEDFIDGALSPGRKDMGPNARFGYPVSGGMQALADRLIEPVKEKIRLSSKVVRIDVHDKRVITASGEEYSYKHLVLTSPLTEITSQMYNLPSAITDIIRTLEYLPVMCVNVGVREPRATEKHWIYFPEQSFLFHRIFVQGNASPGVTPEGCFSYTAEITYNKNKIVTPDAAASRTVDGLIAAGLVRERKHIDVVDIIDIPVGYVVPTHNREMVVSRIRRWLSGHDVYLSGRFAEWAYYNMDHALDAGWKLAGEMNHY